MKDKQCPYCGEVIKASAVKCRFCGEWLNGEAIVAAPREEYAVAEPISMAKASQIPQIVINNEISQDTEVNVDVNAGSSSSSSGWLWTELFFVSGIAWGIWNFWIGLAAMIILAIAVKIPFLGHIICIVLGAAVGFLVGVVAAVLNAPTWVAVLVGAVLGFGAISINLNDRKADDDY